MKQYLIETDHLTKQYGEQKSVSDLSIHVKEGRIYGFWEEMEREKPQP